MPPNNTTGLFEGLIVSLAARYRLPAVYARREIVEAGGLMSYSSDRLDDWRNSAAYIDRLLRGAKAADLPVQTPTKYETVFNLKTAKAAGFQVPPGLLIAADEVIE